MYRAFGFPEARDLVIGLMMFQKVFVPGEALVMRVITLDPVLPVSATPEPVYRYATYGIPIQLAKFRQF